MDYKKLGLLLEYANKDLIFYEELLKKYSMNYGNNSEWRPIEHLRRLLYIKRIKRLFIHEIGIVRKRIKRKKKFKRK